MIVCGQQREHGRDPTNELSPRSTGSSASQVSIRTKPRHSASRIGVVASVKSINRCGRRWAEDAIFGADHVALLTHLGNAADELSIIITELW